MEVIDAAVVARGAECLETDGDFARDADELHLILAIHANLGLCVVGKDIATALTGIGAVLLNVLCHCRHAVTTVGQVGERLAQRTVIDAAATLTPLLSVGVAHLAEVVVALSSHAVELPPVAAILEAGVADEFGHIHGICGAGLREAIGAHGGLQALHRLVKPLVLSRVHQRLQGIAGSNQFGALGTCIVLIQLTGLCHETL